MTPGPGPRLRQKWADLLAAFWLRPALMVAVAIVAAETLVRTDGAVEMPGWIAAWVYAGGVAGARDVLGAIASATIGVAGTTFSITVAALTLASNQMGPRLLRNFTRDPGNGYALGALLATFAYALVTLRSVHEAEEGAFVPQLGVSVALLLAFACVGVLVWFIHHIAMAISVDRVVALVHADLAAAIRALPRGGEDDPAPPPDDPPDGSAAGPLRLPGGGYLRVLDDDALAGWAAEHGARIRLRLRPGDFAFPGSEVGRVWPAARAGAAEEALERATVLGDTRSPGQDLEFLVRQLVEIGLRALSSGVKDPFTAIAVLDRLGAALCDLAGRRLPDGRTLRDGKLRLERPVTSYAGLLDAMFHPLRQGARDDPGVTIRLLEVLAEVAAVERGEARRAALLRHADLARASAAGGDASVAAAIAERHGAVLRAAA
ncbi:DUF2254 domain-containing protein [Falsiroseomonas sp. CW058]|uniref:DUF2254 domain-containing protein n=1 Tax=Falsiroseomonas sp. CW058 TaxID=3388664 RepID=UPI003D3118E2